MRQSTLRKILRRRGSVLILVVALLVLLALVGTAYLTTTRFDRSAAVANTVNTQKDFSIQSAINVVQANVLDDILDPQAINQGEAATVRPPSNVVTQLSYVPIDSPLADFFLAERLPHLQWTLPLTGAGTAIPRPMWRTVSWPQMTASSAWSIETPDANFRVRPATPQIYTPKTGQLDLVRAFTIGDAYKTGEVVAVPGEAAGLFNYYIRNRNGPFTATTAATAPPNPNFWEKCDPKQYFTYAPTTVEISGVVYPAFYVFNNYITAAEWSPAYNPNTATYAPYVTGPILAGDADGDGIADSVYSKIPLGQINGLTYYLAMRVVDNNSAINLNTAWSNQNDFAFGAAADPAWRTGTLPNYGFFPTNTGLREAFISLSLPNLLGEPTQAFFAAAPPAPTRYHNSNNVDDRLSEITRHNLYRFGYVDGTGTFALGLGPAANDVAGSTTNANSGTWTFRTQGEALTAQLIRRPENPGVGDNNPANNAIGAADARMRWISLPTDGAALAYRGGTLVNPDTPASGIERRFSAAAEGVNALHSQLDSRTPAVSIDSLYISADNNRNDTDIMFAKRSYPLVASNTIPGPTFGVNTMVDRWFDANYNFDRWREPSRFTKETTAGSEIAGADAYFRSIRPLVVTANPVSNVIGPRAGVSGTVSVPVDVADILTNGNVNVDYDLATAIGNFELGSTATNWGAPTNTNIGTIDAIVGSFSAMRQYRNPGMSNTQSLATTTIPKVSANTAEFGDLWRAYWNVMAENWADVAPAGTFNMANTGTPFEREIEAYQTALGGNNFVLANPYWGGRFGGANLGFNDFNPARTNTSSNANGQLVGAAIQQVPVMPQLPFTPNNEILEYNPMRMFRSVIRSFMLNRTSGQETASGVIATNYFLRPDQVALLRSALAAVNAEDLRDTDFKVTRRTINLIGTNANGGTAALAATINGYEPQPFITEVFATTDTVGVRTGESGGLPNNGIAGTGVGYVAIELHNPYPFPIDIANCKIACINRFDETQVRYPGMFVEDMESRAPATLPIIDLRPTALTPPQSNLSGTAAYLPPTVIPPNGYLVLESYNANTPAGHRPAATRVSGITTSGNSLGPINSIATGARVNFAYVPNLDRVINREMVLLRPVSVAEDAPPLGANAPRNGFVEMNIGALGGNVPVLRYDDPRDPTNPGAPLVRTRAVNMVPMDSYDFTGLVPSSPIVAEPIGPAVPVYAYTIGQARSWHYVRANESVTVNGAAGTGAWKFVYPGRYDGTKYASRTTGGLRASARQQGTMDSGFWTDTDQTGNPTDPTPPDNPTDPGAPTPQLPGLRLAPGTRGDPWEYAGTAIAINLGRPDSAASYRYTYGNYQRGEFVIPLAHRGGIPFGIRPADNLTAPNRFFPAMLAGAAIEIAPFHYPFGGFARNGDLLEVPYIGSYRIQLPQDVGNTGAIYTPNPAYPTNGFPCDVVLELNPITMDAVMAEDTDVLDDPIVGANQPDIGFQSREQIGRFVPLRKTWLPALTGNDASATTPANLNEPPDYNGRTVFVPLTPGEPHAVLYDDMVPNVEGDPTVAAYTRTSINRYRWAADLFDYLTVQSPSQDYQPNSVPDTVKNDNFALVPTPVHNTLRSSANDAGETNLPFEGLVNINTASERVLAMLPWVPNITGGDLFTFSAPDAEGVSTVTTVADGVPDNLQIARAIVRFRNGLEVRWATVPPAAQTNFRSRPFMSAWDLYRVPELREIQKLFLDPLATNPAQSGRALLDDRVGDISPYPYEFGTVNFNGKFFGVGEILRSGPVTATGPTYYQCITSHISTGTDPAGDAVNWRATNNIPPLGASRAMFDYEEQSLLLNRVSNLITTRSDMFTAYVLIEGWENAGTDKATLRTSKRAAFFLDRSQTTPGKIELKAPIPIPTE